MQRDNIPYRLSVKDLVQKHISCTNNHNKEKYMIDTFDEFEQNNQSVANENQNRSDQA